MSVEHMAMVFAAEGLEGGEKLLLLAFTNYTDPHGYCWPGEERLAEDTGTSVSTVRRTKKKLISSNLVRSVHAAGDEQSGTREPSAAGVDGPGPTGIRRQRDRSPVIRQCPCRGGTAYRL